MKFWRSYVIAFLVSFSVAFFYRTFDLQVRHFWSDDKIEERVQNRVEMFMRYQLEPQLREKVGDVSEKEFKEIFDRNLEGLKKRDYDEFNDKLNKTRSVIAKNDGLSRVYITGADSYHYLDLSKRIDRTGNISDKFKAGGKYFHEMRRYPRGTWPHWTLHPYLGYAWHKALTVVFPKLDIMTSLCTFPLLLLLLAYIAYFYMAYKINVGPWAACLGALALAHAPIFIERAAYGWYDTDGHFFVLPVVIFTLFFVGSRQESRKKVWIYGAISGVLTILYSYLWIGWPLVFCLVIGSGLLIWLLSFVREDMGMPEVLHFMAAYTLSTFALALIVMTPMGVYRATIGTFIQTMKFSAREVSGWPDMFIIVRETQPLDWEELQQHSGSFIAYGIAILGVWGFVTDLLKNKKHHTVGPRITLFLFLIASLYLSLKTARFVLLFVLPLSFFVMFGAEWLLGFKWKRPKLPRVAVLVLIFLVYLPPSYVHTSHQMMKTDLRFYNDGWDKVLKYVREETPDNSVIMSWWPSGYFITAMGERPVYSDGASQHYPEAYWTARFYISQDPREALGIIRMLNAGGNMAADFLIDEKGFSIPQAVRLLNKIIKISREKAGRHLPMSWTEAERKKFLDLSHGTETTPTYVMAYHDIVLKASSISLIGRWEFPGEKQFKYDEFTVKDKRYPSSVLRAQVPSDIMTRRGDDVIFHNGTAFNLVSLEPYYHGKKGGKKGRPRYFYYVKDGKFTRSIDIEPDNLKASFLITQREDTVRSVLADPQIIESVLFRMYYFDGASMPAFKKVAQAVDPVTKYRNYTYEVNWDWLKQQEQQEQATS